MKPHKGLNLGFFPFLDVGREKYQMVILQPVLILLSMYRQMGLESAII